jgi:hypothetical protein
MRGATPPAAQRRPRPSAEICGAKVSWCPPGAVTVPHKRRELYAPPDANDESREVGGRSASRFNGCGNTVACLIKTGSTDQPGYTERQQHQPREFSGYCKNSDDWMHCTPYLGTPYLDGRRFKQQPANRLSACWLRNGALRPQLPDGEPAQKHRDDDEMSHGLSGRTVARNKPEICELVHKSKSFSIAGSLIGTQARSRAKKGPAGEGGAGTWSSLGRLATESGKAMQGILSESRSPNKA